MNENEIKQIKDAMKIIANICKEKDCGACFNCPFTKICNSIAESSGDLPCSWKED